MQEWSLSCLLDSRPSGRVDIRELRDWIQVRLQRLQQRCSGQDKRQPALFKYAEQVVDVYNAAFQELTRQVDNHHLTTPGVPLVLTPNSQPCKQCR